MMIAGEILSVQPAEIKFSVGSKQENSCVIQLTNKTDKCVGFRIRTFHLKTFKAIPNMGILPPRATCKVTVKGSSLGHDDDPLTVQTMDEGQAIINGHGNILIQGVIAPDGSTPQDINPEMFKEENDGVIKETNLPVQHVPAPPQTGQEGSSRNNAPRDNGNNARPARVSMWTRVALREPSAENRIIFYGIMTIQFIVLAWLVYFVYELIYK